MIKKIYASILNTFYWHKFVRESQIHWMYGAPEIIKKPILWLASKNEWFREKMKIKTFSK